MDTDSFSYEPFVCSSCRVSTSLLCAATTERSILESWIKWSGILTYKKAVWLLSLWCSYNLNALCCAHLSGIGCGPSTQRNGLKWPDRKKQTYKSSNVFFSFNNFFLFDIFHCNRWIIFEHCSWTEEKQKVPSNFRDVIA